MMATIALWLIAIGILAMAFFLLCIWRAIIGKSTVDIALHTAININTKRVESLAKEMDGNKHIYLDLQKGMKEAANLLKDYTQAKKDAKFRGDIAGDRDRPAS